MEHGTSESRVHYEYLAKGMQVCNISLEQPFYLIINITGITLCLMYFTRLLTPLSMNTECKIGMCAIA